MRIYVIDAITSAKSLMWKLMTGNFHLQKRLQSPLAKKHPGKSAIDDGLLKVKIAAGEPFE